MNPTPPSNPVDNKQQALTNVGIFVAVFIILLVGVKLATWSASKWSGSDTSKEAVVTDSFESSQNGNGNETGNSAINQASVSSAFADGSGEVVLSVSAKKDTVLREVFFYNPHTSSWLKVYDGYRSVSFFPVEVYKVSLAPIKFTKVRVRTLDDIKDIDREVGVENNSSIQVLLEL